MNAETNKQDSNAQPRKAQLTNATLDTHQGRWGPICRVTVTAACGDYGVTLKQFASSIEDASSFLAAMTTRALRLAEEGV